MKIFGFAGFSGSGKTTLIEKLIPLLIARGLKVSLLKHAHHDFDIDQPGKDSWRHRAAGCSEVLISSANRYALIHELRGAPEPGLNDLLQRLAPCDLVLVEGFKRDPVPKLEIHRRATGKPLLFPDDPHIVAIATDEPLQTALPQFALDDAAGITEFILNYLDKLMKHACQPQPMLDVDEASAFLLAQAIPVTDTEEVATEAALGRVLARAQYSTLDVPPLDNSAMDGYAVRCADVASTGICLPVSQRVPAGSFPGPLQAGTVARIFTGAPIPAGADAVVMQEKCTATDDGILIGCAVSPGLNIRRRGDDIANGAEILSAGTRLRAQEMGLAASVGLARLPVFRRLRVAVFFTGDEIVMPGTPLEPGKIYNSNRYTLLGLLRQMDCEIIDLGTIPDDLDATVAALEQAGRKADLIITSGGVSVGEEDHVKPAVERIGKLDLWKIAIKPGKPLAFGQIGDARFIGLPGNPVATFITFCILVRPFILRCQNASHTAPRQLKVRAGFDRPKPDKRREFLRARLGIADDGTAFAELYPNQSSGVLTSTVWADGLVDIPAGDMVASGDPVNYIPFTELL